MIKIKVKAPDFTVALQGSVQVEAKNKLPAKLQQLKEQLAKATPVDTGAAAASWEVSGNTIQSGCEYMETLNAGSSKQAPAFFIEKTLLSNRGVHANGVIVKEK
jgi:hypothetical protein